MPGLVGVVSTRGEPVDLEMMRAMRNTIRHRDWYSLDDYVNSARTLALSRVHLGIRNRDRQPYLARGGRVKIFLHGDIYNDQAMDAGPLELVYGLYQKHGLSFASFLNGSFLVLIEDEDQDTILIASDRLASQPLFYCSDGRSLYFSPEMKSLFSVPSLERKLNLPALADFLANGCFTREHTLIEGIERLNNATVLRIAQGGIERYKYWEYEPGRGDADLGFEHYQRELAGLLRQAVRRRVRSGHAYGILLSGGFDSRGILGCYLETRGDAALNTISWGRDENIADSDCVVARRLAHKLGANHRFYKRPAEEVLDDFRNFVLLGEGLTDEVGSFRVFDRIRQEQGIDIILRGDECFGPSVRGGYLVHDEHTMFRNVDLRSLRYLDAYRRILKPYYYRLLCDLDSEMTKRLSARCKARNLRHRREFFALDVHQRYVLSPLNYTKSFVMESLTPWLDHDILDFVSILPASYRLGRGLYQSTLVKMFPELYGEFAQVGNVIDWADAFRSLPELQRFAYRVLIEEQSVFDEYIDTASLKEELDAFFHTPSDSRHTPGLKARATASAFDLLKLSPVLYDSAHKSAYYLRRWTGRLSDALPAERLIMRLLILKVWGEIFLALPAVENRA